MTYTLVCLKSGKDYYAKRNEKKSPGQLFDIGVQSLKKPELATGYIAAFLARSDSILLSLYLVLWTYSFNEEKDYDAANSKASALSGITYTIIMFTCIVYGVLYSREKTNKRNLLLFMLFLAMIGTVIINFSQEISSYTTYLALSILGIGMSGLLTSSLYLINAFASPEHRGYLTGIQTIFGIVGITLQTFIGAILY